VVCSGHSPAAQLGGRVVRRGLGVFDRDVRVIVVGCGRVGSRLSLELLRDGHEVVVIDKQEKAFRRLPPGWGGQALVGAGFDRDVLELAGAKGAHALAAVTSGDNSNILCARIARESYGIPNVVARIYDPRRAEIYQRLGLPTVATVTWTTDQVMRKLFPDQTVAEWSDPTGRVRLVERLLPLAWCGRRLSALEAETGARVVVVTRAGVPNLGPGDLVGQEGDLLHLAVDFGARTRLDEVLAPIQPEPKLSR
ncbi:MAG: transport system, NAD-binding component, partial [Acidimicrobiaceae bacterium]|nr:transport system, NAD-binding component [Acidimicrobiaceae bacterium]